MGPTETDRESILSIRQLNTYFHKLSYDPSLWKHQSYRLPSGKINSTIFQFKKKSIQGSEGSSIILFSPKENKDCILRTIIEPVIYLFYLFFLN